MTEINSNSWFLASVAAKNSLWKDSHILRRKVIFIHAKERENLSQPRKVYWIFMKELLGSRVEEVLISLELDWSGGEDSGLVVDTLREFGLFNFEIWFGLAESTEEFFSSRFVVIEEFLGSLFSDFETSVVSLNGVSEFSEELEDLVQETLISNELLRGKLGKGSHNGGKFVNLLDGDGLFEHGICVFGEFHEGRFTIPDLLKDLNCFISSIGVFSISNGCFSEGIGLLLSCFDKLVQVVFGVLDMLNGVIVITISSSLLGVAALKSSWWFLDCIIGSSNFIGSKLKFVFAFFWLVFEELALALLFLFHLIGKGVYLLEDGIEGSFCCHLCLDLGHHCSQRSAWLQSGVLVTDARALHAHQKYN